MASFGRGIFICAVLLSCIASNASAQVSPEVARGLAWLQAQMSGDGSIASEVSAIATSTQTRSEAAVCVATLVDASAVPAGLRETLAASSEEPTEHLARKAAALSVLSADTSGLAVLLAQRQNSDGGFGPAPGFGSTVLDTVWAFSALSRGTQFTGASSARAFILSKIESDGGLAGTTLAQRVQNSALGILALQFAGADLLTLNAARQLTQWLQSTQKTDGSWGDSSYLTATSLYALSTQGADSVARASARAYLIARQSTDGSWSADPFLTALVLRAVAIDPAATPQASSIAGIVMNPGTGTPLADAQVTVTGTVGSTASTGGDGRFSFAGLAAGAYTVQIAKPGFTTTTRTATLGYGQSLDLGSIAMGQLSTAGIVKGRVSAAANGLPIGGASVVLSGAISATIVTDSLGNYEISNVPAGSVTIAISRTGFAVASASGSVTPGQTLLFSPTLYDEGDSGVPTTGRLIGKVVAAGTGAALSGVQIELNGAAVAVTGSDGAFNVTLTPQAYAMRIAASGYDAVAGNFLVSAGTLVDAGTVALSAQRTTTAISGRVTDQATGQPVAGASIGLVDGAAASAGLDGSFVLQNLTGTVFDIRVSASGYLTQVWQLQVERPSLVTQDFAIAPQPTSTIDLIDVAVTPQSADPHTAIAMTASVVNSGSAAQDVVLALQVLDQNAQVVALGSAFTADGVNLLGTFALAAGERRAVLFKWNSGQFAPGLYRLVATAVEAGTVSRESPNGRALATRSATLTIAATAKFIGSVTADPPVLRANTGTTVKLSALVQNNGNVDLPAQTYRLQVVDEKTATVVTSTQVAGSALLPNEIGQLAFSDWVPTAGGNFRLEVTALGAAEQGSLTGKLYVGDAASASYTVDKAVVPVGNQTVRATLLVTGQDSATGSISDPLAEPIRAAIQKGVTYNDLQASNWALSNKCLGCHVVTQALVGGELTRRLTTYNNTQRNTLINSLATYRQSNGALYASHPEYSGTQTMLGLWALNAWRAKDELAASLSAAADFLLGRQESGGSWSADHASGWWDARPANTAFNLKSLSEVVETLRRVPSPTTYSRQVWKSGGGLNGTYYLDRTDSGQVLVSNYSAGTIMTVNSDGSSQTLATGLPNPQGLVRAPDGNLYIVTANDVRKRTPDGTGSVLAAIAGANGIAIGPDGHLYVSRYNNSTIYKVSPAGDVTTHLSGAPLSGPVGLAFDASGNLVVTNYSGQSIVRIKPDKSYEMVVTWTNGSPRSVVPFGTGWLVGTTTGAYRYNADWQGERIAFSATEGLTVLADNTIVTGDGGATLAKLVPVAVDGAAKIASYSNAISRAATWLLNDGNVNASSNLELAHRLIGLGSAKRFYAGTALADTLQTKMEQVGTLLRSRQRADGGWGRLNGSGSDSLVTAQVGFALDYLQPSATDPVVQNAIKFLLARQQADGSWLSENGILSTHLAATTWVEIWLPIALDRIGGIDADVTLRFAPNVALSNASLAPTTTTANADGTVTHKWQLVGVTSASRSVQFDLGLADMQLGETRPASVEAFLTFRNSFTNDSVNAPVQIPNVAASAFLGLAVATDKTDYGAGADVAITGQVSNLGVAAAGGAVEYSIYALDGSPVAALGRVPVADLAAGTSGAVPANWNTGTTYAGQYRVEAKLYDSANRYVATARSAFVIQPGGSAGAVTLSGTIRPDKISYAPTEVVRLLDRITNLAVNQNVSDLLVETSIVNPDGSVRWTASTRLVEVPAGGLRDVNYSVPLNAAPSGPYVARLLVKDVNGSVVASDTKTFIVQSSAATGDGLVGTLQATPKQVAQGEVALIAFDVTNRGNDALTDLPLTVNVIDPAAQQIVASYPYSTSLAQSASYASSATWTALGAPGSTYAAVLNAEVGGRTLVLAQDVFTVTAPSVRIQAAGMVKSEARVLVLLSCPTGTQDEPGCLAQRAAAVKASLDALGVVHKVVTTKAEFQGELRCGIYNAYWISGGSAKLDDQLVKEVREAVRRGEGLMLDGENDVRNQLLHPVAGVLQSGVLTQADQLASIAEGGLFSPGSLPTLGQATRFDLLTGQAQGGFEGAVPAIVSNQYGSGHGMLFAFDLVRMLAQPGAAADAQLRDILARSLERLASGPVSLSVGDVAALQTSVTNLGSQAVTVEWRATLPAGTQLLGATLVATQTQQPSGSADGQAIWQATVPAGATVELLMRLKLERAAADLAVPVAIHTVTAGGEATLRDTQTHHLQVRAGDALVQAAADAINALAPTRQEDLNARYRALDAVQQARQALQQGDAAWALERWIAAADIVAGIGSGDTAKLAAAQSAIAWAVEAAADSQCAQAACVTGQLDLYSGADMPLRDTLQWGRTVRNNCPGQIKDIQTTARLVNRRTAAEVLQLWDNLTLPGYQANERRSGWQVLGEVGDEIDVDLSAEWQGLKLPLARTVVRVLPARLQ